MKPRTKTVRYRGPVRLAEGRLQSFDAKALTVDVVLAAGDKFLMDDGVAHDGPYYVVLGTNAGEVKLERLNSGRLNLLDCHGLGGGFMSDYSVGKVLGVFEEKSARFMNLSDGRPAVVATCRLSGRADLAGLREDVQGGIVTQVSPGIAIHKLRLEGDLPTDGTPPTFRAVLWEPKEVSLTAVPRQANSYLLNDEQNTTTEVQLTSANEGAEDVPTEAELAAAAAAAAAATAAPKTPAAAATAVATDAQLAEVQTRERDRASQITALCEKAKLPTAFAQELIGGKLDLAAARERIVEKWEGSIGTQTPAAGSGRFEVNETELTGDREAITQALIHRGNQTLLPVDKLSERARGFVHYSLMDVAKHLLELRGTKTRGRGAHEILGLSLHSGSDFPLVLANSAMKTLRDQYDVVPRTWQLWAKRGVLPDFKPNSRVQLGGAPALEEIPDTGVFPSGTIGEQAETIQGKAYGKMVGLSRVAMINDDLGAFLRIPAQFGVSAATLEDDLAYAGLTANANMSDAVALFHATHKNLSTGGGSALAIAGLKAARGKMRQQTGIDGKYLNLQPKYVLVPSALETEAEQLLVATQVVLSTTTTTNVNTFLNKLVPIVQPRLDAISLTAWYMLVDPTYCDTVEVAFLAGSSGPRIETEVGFEVDGVRIKCAHDVGVKPIDWRGMVRSDGV